MASKDSVEAQKISVDLINDNPDHLRSYFKRKDSNPLSKARNLNSFSNLTIYMYSFTHYRS